MSDVKPNPPMRLRAALDAIPAYKPGKSSASGDQIVYKISSNENPYPPLPGVVEAVADAATRINRYPDAAAVQLSQVLADRLNVTTDELSFATGSSGLLFALHDIACEPGDEVVFAWRSFEMYPIVTALSGADAVKVPLADDGRHDLKAMAAAVTDKTRLVIVCSPNNPTGAVVHDDELREFLAVVPKDVIVVLDEAYLEFVRDPQAPDAMAIYRDFPNVVVLRTFSKAYGLAGLRIGYAVASPEITGALRKAIMPFGVSDLAQHAALASLERMDELNARVDALVAERTRVVDALTQLGVTMPDAQSNFVWLPLGEKTLDFAAFADERGLIVRPFAGDGARCTIAETEANDRLIEVVRDFYTQNGLFG